MDKNSWEDKKKQMNDAMMIKMFGEGISKDLFEKRMKKLNKVKAVCMKCLQNKLCLPHKVENYMENDQKKKENVKKEKGWKVAF